MISIPQPSRRLATLVSVCVLLTVVCLTFTRAADPQAVPKPAEASPNKTDLDRAKRERSIQRLENEWRKHDDVVRVKEAELDALRAQLGLSAAEASETPGQPETLGKLEALRIDASADYERLFTLHRQLTRMTRADLQRALPTASPDPLLTSLVERQTDVERRLVELGENFSQDHPEMKSTRRVAQQLDKQINERIDGILAGIKAKMEAEKARMELLKGEVDKLKSHEAEQAQKGRPYWQAKRDLENLRMIRDRLQMRLAQERLDAVMDQ